MPATPIPATRVDHCQICGTSGATRHVTFRQNIGAIVLRFHRRIEGELCARCVESNFRETTLITALAGWWGIVSFFVTPFVLISNLSELMAARAGFRGDHREPANGAANPLRPHSGRAPDRTLAMVAFALGLASLVLCSGIGVASLAGAALGVVALLQIRRSPERHGGFGFAAAGVAFSLVALLAFAGLVYFVRNAPDAPAQDAGRAGLRAADAKLMTYQGNEAFGNSPNALEMAARMASTCGALSKLATAEKPSGLSLSEGHCLTHVEARESGVCFLVHVPGLRHYSDEAKKSLLDVLWASARAIVREGRSGGEPKLAVALRGALMYGPVGTGSTSDGRPGIVNTETQAYPDELEPFFSGPETRTGSIAAPSRPAKAAPTPSPLTRVTDAKEVARALALGERRDQEAVTKVLGQLHSEKRNTWSVDASTIRRLERAGDKARTPLRGLAADPAEPPLLRMRAASVLIGLGDESSWRTVASVLSATPPAQSRDLLALLPGSWSPVHVPREALPDLEKLLEGSNLEVALGLLPLVLRAGTPASARQLQLLEQAEERHADAYRLGAAVAAFVETTPAGGALRARGLRLWERLLRGGNPGQFAFASYARHADAASIPFLNEILAKTDKPAQPGKAQDTSWDRHAILTALARLKAAGVRDKALALLGTDQAWLAFEPLSLVAAGTGDAEILDRLRATCLGKSSGLQFQCCRAVVRVGGPRAPGLARELAASLQDRERLEIEAELAGSTAASVWGQLAALHLASGPLPRETEGDTSRGLNGRLRAALESTGRLVSFDTETGYLPVPHDELIEDFARASLGRFRPQAVVQKWHSAEEQPRLSDDLDVANPGRGYTVQFVHGGRLYRFHAEDLGDWYDVRSVVAAVNAALADATVAERFVGLGTGGQDASYLFGDPREIQQAAKRGLITVDSSDAEAMERGKAFEQQVVGTCTDALVNGRTPPC